MAVEREWSTHTCYKMDEPWKHYNKWKKPDTKDHIFYEYLYKISRLVKSIQTEIKLVVARDYREVVTESDCLLGTRLAFWVIKMFWNEIVVIFAFTLWIYEMSLNCILWIVNFVMCIFPHMYIYTHKSCSVGNRSFYLYTEFIK